MTASVSRTDGGRRKKATVKAQRGVASGFPRGTMMVKVFRFWVCSEHRTTGCAFSTHLLRPSSTQHTPAETQVSRSDGRKTESRRETQFLTLMDFDFWLCFLTCCVTSGKLLNVSVPSPLKWGVGWVTRVSWRINGI